MIMSLASIGINIPAITPGLIGTGLLTGIQSIVTLSSFSTETNPTTRAQYSKFAEVQIDESKSSNAKMIPSRDGMTFIYLPAFLVSLWLYVLPEFSKVSFVPGQSLAGQFVILHFLKRLLEVYFVHKYSGMVSQSLSATIGTYYAIVSTIILCVANTTSSISDLSVIVGTGLFGIGLVGNLYHHILLAGLRDKTKTDGAKYVAPVGGLFNYVAAPHYLFELIGWLGIAIVANHLNAFLVFTSMTSYLSGRACSQNEWNRSKFSDDDWPSTRKNIVPFLF